MVHYTWFGFKIGNKTVTERLQYGYLRRFVYNFVIMNKIFVFVLHIITITIVHEI